MYEGSPDEKSQTHDVIWWEKEFDVVSSDKIEELKNHWEHKI